MGLLFSVSDLQNELNSFARLASRFLAPGAAGVLANAESQLLGIARSSGDRPLRWTVNRENPVTTKPSVGAYMPNARGSLTLYAEVTFIWEIVPYRPSGDSRAAKSVRLVGLASTAVRLLQSATASTPRPKELAYWRMEVADDSAPGTFFHVQILGRDDDLIFPKELDVPRLPGVLNSPFACMEYVLSELFQDDWTRTAQAESAPSRQWSSIQTRRHEQHLTWALQKIRDSSGSPWVAWKTAKPHEHLFLER